jgi:DNA-binding NarL/FixJ family response regulator
MTTTIAEKTVEHHVQHIPSKVGRSTRAGAARVAAENGLVQLSRWAIRAPVR